MTLFSRVVLPLCLSVGAAHAAEPPAVTSAWVRATPPGARTAAAYMTIAAAESADTLVGAATPAAGAVEIHAHVVESGMSRMVRRDELAVPAGGSVRLEPGGLHLMLLDLPMPLAAGETITLRLQFATAGAVELEVPVVDARAGAPAPRASH